MAPFDVMDLGRMAVLAEAQTAKFYGDVFGWKVTNGISVLSDPQGAFFALHQSPTPQ